MYIIICVVNGVSESNNRALMTSHDESRRGARPPGADDGGRNQSLQKDLSRTWLFAIIVRAPQSPRCEIYHGRCLGIGVLHMLESASRKRTNETKKKNRLLYSTRPVVCIMMNRYNTLLCLILSRLRWYEYYFIVYHKRVRDRRRV